MKNHNIERLITGVTVAVILLSWYVVCAVGLVTPVIVPSPKQVLNAFFAILRTGYKNISLLEHIGVSLKRLLIAFVLASATAVPLGLLCGHNRYLRSVFEPVVEFFRPLPPLAYYTLIVLWMGIDDSSKIALLALAAFAPIYVAGVSAMQMVQKSYIDNALTMGASNKQIFWYVSMPACLPQLFVGIRTAVSVAYTTLVAAEMVAAVSGIGWLVLDASRFLRSDIVFVGILIMGLTGILIDRILRLIETKLIFWKGHN